MTQEAYIQMLENALLALEEDVKHHLRVDHSIVGPQSVQLIHTTCEKIKAKQNLEGDWSWLD